MAKSIDEIMKNPMPMPEQQAPQQESQNEKSLGMQVLGVAATVGKKAWEQVQDGAEHFFSSAGMAELASYGQAGLQDAQNYFGQAFPQEGLQQASVPGMAGFSTQYQLTERLEGHEADGEGLGPGIHGANEPSATVDETTVHGPQETPSTDMNKLQAYTQPSRSNENELQR